MRRRALFSSTGAGALVLLLLGTRPACAKEGFGLFKKAATVMRSSPSAVLLLGTRIEIQSTSPDPAHRALADRLRTQLESALIGRDRRLVADPTNPQTLIEVAVLQNAHSEKWERRKEAAIREVGKDAKGKAILQTYEVEVNYKVISHLFEATYKVTDRTRRASLDAGQTRVPFAGSYREGEGTPEAFSLEAAAIGKAVEQIANRLTPTREEINMLLPKGSFEDLIPLAVSGQWNRYLEALEKRAPAAKPIDESYRQYALGVAYEALGYAADDPADTLRYLEQADLYYGKAIEANPQEKFFSLDYTGITAKNALPPPERVRSALASYRRIKDLKDRDEVLAASGAKDAAPPGPEPPVPDAKSLPPAPPRPAAEATPSAPPASPPAEKEERDSGRMDNQAVIRMAQAGLPSSVILNAIDGATDDDFDVSATGLIELSKGGVENEIILYLQQIVAGKKRLSGS